MLHQDDSSTQAVEQKPSYLSEERSLGATPPGDSDGREQGSRSMATERPIRTTVPEEVRAVSETGAKRGRRRSLKAVVLLRTGKRGLCQTTMTECSARITILVEVRKTEEAATKSQRHPFETTVSIGVKTQGEQRRTTRTRRSIRTSVSVRSAENGEKQGRNNDDIRSRQ